MDVLSTIANVVVIPQTIETNSIKKVIFYYRTEKELFLQMQQVL